MRGNSGNRKWRNSRGRRHLSDISQLRWQIRSDAFFGNCSELELRDLQLKTPEQRQHLLLDKTEYSRFIMVMRNSVRIWFQPPRREKFKKSFKCPVCYCISHLFSLFSSLFCSLVFFLFLSSLSLPLCLLSLCLSHTSAPYDMR